MKAGFESPLRPDFIGVPDTECGKKDKNDAATQNAPAKAPSPRPALGSKCVLRENSHKTIVTPSHHLAPWANVRSLDLHMSWCRCRQRVFKGVRMAEVLDYRIDTDDGKPFALFRIVCGLL
jgi:hypothetical protein